MREEPANVHLAFGTWLAAGSLGLAISCFVGSSADAGEVVHAVFKSTDRGRSWSRSDRGLPGSARINALGTLSNVIFAGTDAGIFLSRDEGQNWQRSAGGAPSAERITCMTALEPKVYAGTDGQGLLMSSDRGATWFFDRGFATGKVRCLLRDRNSLYAGMDADGVLVSTGSGGGWTSLNQGLPAHAQVFGMAVVSGSLFAGLYSKGLYRWSEEEQRWMRVGGVSPLALAAVGDTLVAGHNPGGIYWSADLGATWSRGTPGVGGELLATLGNQTGELSSDAPVWEMTSSGDLVFAGAGPGIYCSDDRGRTWVRARVGLPSESPGVSFLLKGDTVFAGTMIRDPGFRGGETKANQKRVSQ